MSNPGCYGMAIVYNSRSDTCGVCKSRDGCQKLAYAALLEMSEEVDVSDLLRHHPVSKVPAARPTTERAGKVSRLTVTAEQAQQLAVMKKKPAALAKSLFQRGIDIRQQLSVGINPFVYNKPCFMKVPCAMLLERGISKPELKRRLLSENKHWGERTAEGQVSLIISLLTDLKVVTDDGVRFILRKQN